MPNNLNNIMNTFTIGGKTFEIEDASARTSLTTINTRVTALEAGGSGSGLTDTQKRAILNCFAHMAWTDAQGQIYYDELENVLFNNTELSRITASYSNENSVYPDTALDDLRPYITVRAYYTDETNAPINAYTIHGELEIGQNTLTITYESKTATIIVTAVEKLVSDMTHWTDGIKYTDIDVVENSYYTNTGSIASYNNWSRTGYIPIDGASTIVFDALNISSALNNKYNWFFDANKTPISGFSTNTTATTVIVPENAYYFGISGETTKVTAVMDAGFTPYV